MLSITQNSNSSLSYQIINFFFLFLAKFCTNGKPIHLLKIRSNSPYWSKQGTLREITQAIYTTNLALLKVQKNFQIFPNPDKIFPIAGAKPKGDTTRRGTSAGWVVENKEKFGRYSIVRWGADCLNPVNCERPVFGNANRCSKSYGDPLIDEQDALIG